MSVLPFWIVTDDVDGCKTVQPQTHVKWGKITIRKVDTAAKAQSCSGGLVPITAAGYAALVAAGCPEDNGP